MPGTRAPADPKAAVARKFARDAEAVGLDLSSINPDELARFVQFINKKRARAGQMQAT